MASLSLILDAFLPYRLSYTANLVSEVIASAYKSLFGLTIAEWRVVAHVAENDAIAQQEICQRTRMDKVTISRAAIALAERGLVERVANPQDRRSHRLRLSAAGRRLYAAVAPKALELEQAIFSELDERETATLVAMLRRLDTRVLAMAEARAPAEPAMSFTAPDVPPAPTAR